MSTLPDALKDAPQFLLDNPAALQKKHSKLKGDPNMMKERDNLSKVVKAAEQNVLEVLVELIDWLVGLEPQSTKEIVSLDEDSQAIEAKVTNVLAEMNQAVTMAAKIEEQKRKLQMASTVRFSICRPNHILIGRRTWRHAPTSLWTRRSGNSSEHPNSHTSATCPTATPTAAPPAYLL
jgi:hypothetical protein